ncbi:hypothetical protein HY024_03835 [Candidatus Curtissbacteria bacterium]|nr:hypothetical protein [Candidatus Curtissbacteria bacterium]
MLLSKKGIATNVVVLIVVAIFVLLGILYSVTRGKPATNKVTSNSSPVTVSSPSASAVVPTMNPTAAEACKTAGNTYQSAADKAAGGVCVTKSGIVCPEQLFLDKKCPPQDAQKQATPSPK